MTKHTTICRLLGGALILYSSTTLSQLPIVSDRTPTGATVGTASGHELIVNQTEDRAIVDWTEFSIGEGYTVRFNQLKNQAILNRVTGSGKSQLLGDLKADGAVWLINPNGVLIGSSGRIDTRSFVASTLPVTDEQFLNNPDTINLEGASTAGIENLEHITTTGGDIILVARQVSNAGELKAPDGAVRLAAGNEVELTFVRGDQPGIAVRSTHTGSAPVGVDHEGVIEAAHVELAAAGGNIYGMAVNVTGNITTKPSPVDA